MILIDTSVWIDHFHRSSAPLSEALEREEVLTHPYVIGELACGNLKNRKEVLHLIGLLPMAPAASHDEAMMFLEQHELTGRGIGYVDVHLLAAVALGQNLVLWTSDRRLHSIAAQLKLGPS